MKSFDMIETHGHIYLIENSQTCELGIVCGIFEF